MSHDRWPNSIGESIDATVQLIFTGASVLYDLRCDNDGKLVSFQHWATAVRDSAQLGKLATIDEHLIWLWETLRTAPDLRDYFGDLPCAMNPWTNKQQCFDVLEPGECFLIGMNNEDVAFLLRPSTLITDTERVRLHTKARLQMRPGKGHRLECCDCLCEVTIQVDEVFTLTREADIMRIEEKRIELGNGFVRVQVDSLNQAYTVSSRRLEPKRRSHGGRTYDRLVHIGKDIRMRLEDIRQLVESGTWPAMLARNQQLESIFEEPQRWGLRGDPFLWRELRQHLIETGLPTTPSEFVNFLESQFKERIGVPLATDQESVFVQRYSYDGMSSGYIDPEWWRRTGLPLLHERFNSWMATDTTLKSRGINESH